MLYLNANETKALAKSLNKALKARGQEVALGQVLDALAATRGHKDWNSLSAALDPSGVDEMLSPFELDHAQNSVAAEEQLSGTGGGFGPECVVRVHSGFFLKVAAYPDEVDYLRVCDPLGREIAYWSIDEVKEDPADVLGAVVGALVRGQSADDKPPVQRAYEPSLEDLDFNRLCAVRLNGQYFGGLAVDEDGVESLRKLLDAKDLPEEEREALEAEVVLHLWEDDEGLETRTMLYAGDLAQLKWDASSKQFSSEENNVRFILAYEFGEVVA